MGMKYIITEQQLRYLIEQKYQNNDIDSVYHYFKDKDLNYEFRENLESSYEDLKELTKDGKVKAYRVLNVNTIDDIDQNNLGLHFTTDIRNINDDFLEKIGVIDHQGYYKFHKFFIIEVETDLSNIDWYETFDNRINYYGEDEINFIDDKKVYITKIEEIEI
jgi:hypothetical protein